VEQLAMSCSSRRELTDDRNIGGQRPAIRESGSDRQEFFALLDRYCGIPHDLDEGQFAADALYTRPRCGVGHPRRDDRNGPIIYIDVTRPWLTIRLDFQKWITRKQAWSLAREVTAIDVRRRQRLAIDIVNQIRSVVRSGTP